MERCKWYSLAEDHSKRVANWCDDFVTRRAHHERHPVYDFLFTYYPFPPAKLKKWVPPLGVEIEITSEDETWLAQTSELVRNSDTERAYLDRGKMKEAVVERAAWVVGLCRGILQRPHRFRCYGLHEWAMVYRQKAQEVRHPNHPLRLSARQLTEFVESQTLCCTHYDAFRFFTEESKTLNAFEPTLESRTFMEQGACLHANMDLYKWAFKLWPWIGSDLVGRTFELAIEGRVIDMRASPYDLAELGFDPILIETVEGRQQYEVAQRALAGRADVLREELAVAAAKVANQGV